MFEPTVVIYYRPLQADSEAAMQTIERVHPFEKFVLQEVDVAQDPRAEALHGDQVPLIAINGQVAFRGGVDEDRFIRRLRIAREEMARDEEERIHGPRSARRRRH